jgi:hypothetical protein
MSSQKAYIITTVRTLTDNTLSKLMRKRRTSVFKYGQYGYGPTFENPQLVNVAGNTTVKWLDVQTLLLHNVAYSNSSTGDN